LVEKSEGEGPPKTMTKATPLLNLQARAMRRKTKNMRVRLKEKHVGREVTARQGQGNKFAANGGIELERAS